ncbi:MAG: hypothetical protein H6Q91_1840 [Deltaproteobacteria bacterium]|jgi:hypothetical protein|nr:hypothetical protein [Deltaproteobacteria bacterium]
MTDELLLAIGCVITFIAAAGAYVALRSGFAHGWMKRREMRAAALREARTAQ